MSIYLSRESVSKWADRNTASIGMRLWQQGAVQKLDLSGDLIRADIGQANRTTHTRFKLNPDGSVETRCPCRMTQERGLVCGHVISAGLQIAWLTEDPVRERRRRITDRIAHESDHNGVSQEFLPRIPLPEGEPPATRLRLRLETEWRERLANGRRIEITCQVVTGESKKRLDKIPPGQSFQLCDDDIRLLYIIEDLARTDHTPGTLYLDSASFNDLLAEVAVMDQGMSILGSPGAQAVNDEPLIPLITVRMDTQTGTCRLVHQIDMVDPISYIISRKQVWAFSPLKGFRPIEAVLPETLHGAYRSQGIEISRHRVVALIRDQLPEIEDGFIVDCGIAPDMFDISKGTPQFELVLSGSPEQLAFRVGFRYGDTRVPASREESTPPHCMPVAGAPCGYITRDLQLEEEGLAALAHVLGETPSGGHFPDCHGAEYAMQHVAKAAAFCEREHWNIQYIGMIANYVEGAEWVTPSVTMQTTTKSGWFHLDVGYTTRDGTPIPTSVVEDALHMNRSLVHMGEKNLLIDRSRIRAVESLCAEVSDNTDSGPARVSDIHAGYLTETLADMSHVAFEAPPEWREHASRQSGRLELGDVELNDFLESTLRPYQRDGVRWLRFLETGSYSGILADEMGLGKTIQTLAWIQLERLSPAAAGKPALVVCPTSLVDNWAAEARKFTPDLVCHTVKGSKRHADWHRIAESDLVVTSYALLRRDIEHYQDCVFSIAVLDEAQHIKNHSTLNAQAAKQVRAAHRLVLTGTPIENSVMDLWSIMDFLMPRYLGSHAQFRERVERPVTTGGEQAGQALLRLRRKLHPFMLRRMKSAVAKDLPPKIARIAVCSLSPEQERLYTELEHQYREQLHDLVGATGPGSSQFTVLKTLLRLRQACCHPSLVLKDQVPGEIPGPEAAARSGKLELFLELLNEAMDSGQRVLVFSQFVEMLKLVRQALDIRGIRYSYLDGSTINRQDRVDEFNSDDTIPVFLVSLKAGGSGLNLTGASVVIHFDPWWNPAVEDQATDRAHRIGQDRTVYSIKLVTQGTVEERVIDLQQKKRRLINAAVADQQAAVQSLTWEDIRTLLAL